MNYDTQAADVQNHLADYLIQTRLDDVNLTYEEITYKESFYVKYMKRLFDICISLVALIVTLPINLVIGIVVLCVLGRPLFFVQERVGKDGKLFKIIKFRNMTNATDEKGNLLPPQQRLTKLGIFLRKTSLDELLNFWSILKGDMSLIGPRPLPPVYLPRFSKRHLMRTLVKPGLECPQWIRTNEPILWNDQFENDIWYVKNVSFAVDCKMLLKLFQYTFSKKNSEMRANCEKGSFIGYTLDGKAISSLDLPEDLIDEIMKNCQN